MVGKKLISATTKGNPKRKVLKENMNRHHRLEKDYLMNRQQTTINNANTTRELKIKVRMK